MSGVSCLLVSLACIEGIWLCFMFLLCPFCALANGEWEGGVKGEIYDPFFKWAGVSWFSTSRPKAIIGIIFGPLLALFAGIAKLLKKVA